MDIDLTSVPGFYGLISRDTTCNLLKSSPEGTYLIRESAHYPGDYTISICSDNIIEHYRIQYKQTPNEKPFTIDNESYFDDLNQLIQHYKRDADGLCCQLVAALISTAEYQSVLKVKNGGQINKSDLDFVEQIGKGEFSEVHKAMYKGTEVAVKVVKDESLAALFITEATTMQSLNHPNLVLLKGLVHESDLSICIVTEFMAKGSLVEYLRTRGRTVIGSTDQIRFAKDVCSGMAYLEDRKLVHRDLAARNVLLNDQCMAKVSDFGLAMFDSGEIASKSKIPVKWTAPEALKHHRFTSKSDVWSFGILLWEIYTFGRVPYPRISLTDVSEWIEEGNRMDRPDNCPDPMFNLMTSAWQWEAQARPTFREILLKLNDTYTVCKSTFV